MSGGASDFGRELLACAVDGTSSSEHPLRHVADLAPRNARAQPWPRWAEPDVVRGLRRTRHRRAVVTSGGRPRTSRIPAATWCSAPVPRRASRSPTSCRSLSALAADPRARALYLSPTKALGHDQLRAAQALTDAVARLADVGPSAYDGDSSQEARRFARETLAVDLLQPRHDPSVAAAQPRQLGGVPAQPQVHRGRRMPLLPWHLRVERGDGAAPVDAAVRALRTATRQGRP